MTVLAAAADASVLLALALLVAWLLRRRPAALRHAVLAAGLTAAAAAPLLEAVGPRWEIPILASADVTSSGLTFSPDQPTGAAWIESASTTGGSALGWIDIVMLAWAAGALVLLSTLLMGITRLIRLTRRCQPLESEAWHEQAAQLSRELGLKRPIALLESRNGAMLVTWGFRPRVIVPAGAAAWPAERVHVVLAHELAHVMRRDWVLQIAAELVCAIYWFNPLVWIACRRLRDESELACDDAVLTRGVAPADYATHLLDVARQAVGTTRAWTAAPAIAHPSTLERRIAAMLNASHDRAPLRRGAGLVAAIVMLVIATPMAALTLTEQAPPAPAAPNAGRDVTLIPAPAPAPRPVTPVAPVPRPRPVAPAPLAPASATAAAGRQQAPASVSGTMSDPSGGVLPGVEMALIDRTSGVRASRVTDGAGRFRFPDLTPGPYTLTATLPGFATVVSEFTLAPGQNLERRIGMRIGSLQETITVTCAAGAAALPAPRPVFAADTRARASRLSAIAVARKMAHAIVAPVAAAQATPVRVGGQIRVPRMLRRATPVCPSAVLPAANGTTVTLEATIGTDGYVNDIRPLTSAGEQPSAEFIESAREAVRQWQYMPTLLNNSPVPVIMTVTISYQRK